VLDRDADLALNYGPAYAGLREQLVTRLRAQGIEAEDNNVLVSYGSGQILALLPQVFVDPGDVVLIEGPSFMGAVRQFSAAGARLVTVPTDAQGMDVDALEQTLIDLRRQGVRPKFIYTIPTFHNPTGATMPLARRQKLVALGAEYGVVIVEDDAYGDLRFEGQPLPNLAMLDQEGWVIRVSTFSKILAPGVRMGWAYARPEIIERLATFKTEGSSGPFLTRVIAQYCAEGRLEAHIEELITLYRHKRDVMLEAIGREFPAEVSSLRPEGGFFVWCKLPTGMRATELLPLAEAHGATFLAGTRCFADGQGDDSIRLAFSFLPVEQIEEGIARIGAAMRAI
jgi:2-aminoadipate transaminase